jgi:hypothetical protein
MWACPFATALKLPTSVAAPAATDTVFPLAEPNRNVIVPELTQMPLVSVTASARAVSLVHAGPVPRRIVPLSL